MKLMVSIASKKQWHDALTAELKKIWAQSRRQGGLWWA